MSNIDPSMFKAYDVRGIYPDQLNEEVAYRIGRAYSEFIKPKTVLIGRDIRLSSKSISEALARGLTEQGMNVVDAGQIGTDMVYFGVAHYHYDGGIMITASHNPKEYNGMKFVREQSIPISGDTGIYDIRDLAISGEFSQADKIGEVEERNIYQDYTRHVLSFIDPKVIKPCKVVLNGGNGVAGEIIPQIINDLPIQAVPMYFEPDGTFPKGEPNPLLPENRTETIKKVKEEKADLGVAWDGDADRCFFIDEKGNFIEGYFITALLAETLLKRQAPGEKIIFDPRLTWANIDVVNKYGGVPIINKSGHAFFKERMRRENALFAGEMSAHFYFRENYFADNGIIPFLLILELMSTSGNSLSELLEPLVSKYFISGEINRRVEDGAAKIKEIEGHYQDGKVEHIDGLSVEFPDWRFNLRTSNTEPLIRLNVEARSKEIMEAKRDELLEML
ncbi:MAG: phosphomannomutase/phosphoglucomutase [bacterium]|nr:phosphomannomutase/phosphoglucomutase [bacterium]